MVAYRYVGTQHLDPFWYDSLEDGTTARTRSPLPGILKEMAAAYKPRTGLEPAVAAILRSDPVNLVNFQVENNIINKKLMELVAKAVIQGTVEIIIGDSGEDLDASYSSWKSRRKKIWEWNKVGEIEIKRQDVISGKAAVFHECVHALKDIRKYKMAAPGGKEKHRDEAFAFLAETMFRMSLNLSLSIERRMPIPKAGKPGAVYAAATAIIDSKNMLTNPGTVLKWSDCDGLLAAVKAIKVYR